jgi:lipopolysaccharide heptosyltransferase I
MGSALRSLPLRDYPARRIVIIKPSALGDIIHALPVLTAVRRRFPEAYIAWVVNRALEPLLRGHPDLDATLPFDRAAARSGPVEALRSYVRLFRRLRRGRFDLALDLQGLFRSGVMTRATGAARRLGLGCAREGATWFYTDIAPVVNPDGMHAVDRCWAIAEALGVGDLPKTFRLHISPEEEGWAAQTLQQLPRPWIMLGVGARWLTKRWPAQHFAELAQRALDRFGGSIFLVGGVEDVPLARQAAQQMHGPILDLTGQTTLPQLAALLARADVMISNDTGPLHLAVALGRPVVAPYTCTSIVENGPYGMASNAVESSIWCHGSYLTKCPRLECMAELTPERLWPVLERVLSTWQCHSRSA